jgi:hypothetical protein
MVAPPGKFLAFASTIVEGPVDGVSPKDVASRELGPALQMMHPFLDVFVDMYDYSEPLADGVQVCSPRVQLSAPSHRQGLRE